MGMSQQDLPKTPAPILHRYDPRQPVTLPARPTPKPVAAQDPAQPSAEQPTASQLPAAQPPADRPPASRPPADRPVEIGGPSGPEPTRYGDWERNGRVSDF